MKQPHMSPKEGKAKRLVKRTKALALPVGTRIISLSRHIPKVRQQLQPTKNARYILTPSVSMKMVSTALAKGHHFSPSGSSTESV